DVDQRVDRAQADRRQPLLQPVGGGTVLHALDQAQAEGRTQRRHVDGDLDRAGEGSGDGFYRAILERADGGRAEIAGDTVDASAVGPVGCEVYFDHRLAECRVGGVAFADRRIGRQVDDAVVIVGELKLGLRHQHAAAFDAANGADGERDVLAG